MTDEEVITIEIGGEFFKCGTCGTDKDIFAYFVAVAHYQAFFPPWRERSLFARQAANLWRVKDLIQQRWTMVSGQVTDPVQIIDTLPLPVCGYVRSGRDRCCKPKADDGPCAAKKRDYYGFTLGLRPGHGAAAPTDCVAQNTFALGAETCYSEGAGRAGL